MMIQFVATPLLLTVSNCCCWRLKIFFAQFFFFVTREHGWLHRQQGGGCPSNFNKRPSDLAWWISARKLPPSDLHSDLWPTQKQLMGHGWWQGISPVDTLADTPIASSPHHCIPAQMYHLVHVERGWGLAGQAGCDEKVARRDKHKNPGDACHKRRMAPWNFHRRLVSLEDFFFLPSWIIESFSWRVLSVSVQVYTPRCEHLGVCLWPAKLGSRWIKN